ncbi:hypothetical protein [Streptomyces sp. NPDC020742]|uniref:hypothetical protein n=1 Tax=unclassified Streptomyces TaxID=2593676 RepID=UPI0033E80B81
MDKGIRRTAGIAVMAGGIALAIWLVFGAPHDWEGDMRMVRKALGLAAMGAISGGARLFFWEPKGESAGE